MMRSVRLGYPRRPDVRLTLTALLALAAAPVGAQDTGLDVALRATDAELAEMRGRFVSADSVRYFGISLNTMWQTGDGVITAARLGFSVWVGNDGSPNPQVVVEWQRDGDPGMNVVGSVPAAANNYMVTSGAEQSNVIAGSDNLTANRMSVAIMPVGAIAPAGAADGFSGTATATAADGDTVTFDAANGQFGLAITDSQGSGSIRQSVASDPGRLSQSIVLNSDHNVVTNTLHVTLGIAPTQMTETVSLTNSLSAMKGNGF